MNLAKCCGYILKEQSKLDFLSDTKINKDYILVMDQHWRLCEISKHGSSCKFTILYKSLGDGIGVRWLRVDRINKYFLFLVDKVKYEGMPKVVFKDKKSAAAVVKYFHVFFLKLRENPLESANICYQNIVICISIFLITCKFSPRMQFNYLLRKVLRREPGICLLSVMSSFAWILTKHSDAGSLDPWKIFQC